MTVPVWIAHALRWLGAALVLIFATATAFTAIVMPYHFWDSLAFGAWSRSIAETGQLWTNAGSLSVSRPLFYVPQGLAWSLVDGEWVGRLLSAAFAAVLVAAVYVLARGLSRDENTRMFLPTLAVGALLSSAVFAAHAAAGMTDIPVAAASAATAIVLWSSVSTPTVVLLAGLGGAATVLAKPSGLLALAGLALATALLRGRRAAPGLAGLALGLVLGLAYHASQAARLDVSLAALLRAGNDDFYLERGEDARWDAIVSADWMGAGTRLIVVYGLGYAIARVVGGSARTSLAAAAVTALVASIAGPLLADGELGYPFDGSPLGMAAWLSLAVSLLAGARHAVEDHVPRRTYGALLLWLAPTALIWAWQRPDEARLLAPAWPALALLAGAALTAASLALLRYRPTAALVPAAAVALAALANIVSVDGLGRSGWRELLELGPSGWRDRAATENFAYGPFSYHLNLARENVASDDTIVSSDGRLAYFFPGRVDVAYARRCGEVGDARFFSYLTAGESLEIAALEEQPTNPLGWIQCVEPRLELVGEHEGIYAAFVAGRPPAREPTPADCRITSTRGELIDAVFGSRLGYPEARELLRQALSVGFAGTRIERTGCAEFRVVVTGVPEDELVQADFRHEAKSVGLEVDYAPAERFPEVSSDVAPVEP